MMTTRTAWGRRVAQPRFAEWLLGRHHALLSAGVVCTVDQILYAGSRTKYVSLRHAGLAGKVVIVDEVHSYDVYMGQFLHALLTWCGSAGVPVVLMSATLPPRLRAGLLEAYQRGHDAADPDGATPYAVVPAAADGYPLVTTIDTAAREVRVASATQRRPDLPIRVEVLSEDSIASVDAIADRAERGLVDGGCALVILNTVARPQRTYAALHPCRVVPALAGVIRSTRTPLRDYRRRPRARGGHPMLRSVSTRASTSSPRSRGSSHGTPWARPVRKVVPALAGVIPRDTLGTSCPQGRPRARGGHPE